MEVVNSIAQLMRPYIGQIAISLVACILVIAGGEINRYVRALLRGHNFIIRTFVFILLNAFGYGLVIVHLSPLVARYLAQLDANWLVSVVCLSFVVVGLWAQRNKQV